MRKELVLVRLGLLGMLKRFIDLILALINMDYNQKSSTAYIVGGLLFGD